MTEGGAAEDILQRKKVQPLNPNRIVVVTDARDTRTVHYYLTVPLGLNEHWRYSAKSDQKLVRRGAHLRTWSVLQDIVSQAEGIEDIQSIPPYSVVVRYKFKNGKRRELAQNTVVEHLRRLFSYSGAVQVEMFSSSEIWP